MSPGTNRNPLKIRFKELLGSPWHPRAPIVAAMRFGRLLLDSNLCLSPLAGYTNLPFRLTLRELGGLGLATTDLVNARSLLEKNPKALKLIETCAEDRPLAIQLF